MDTNDFRHWGGEMINFICDYLETLPARKVIPDVQPGYLKPLLPESAPELPEDWPRIFEDTEKFILEGLTHWQHPRFHAYFPAGNSFPSIMADMLSNAVGCIGFSWAASPAIAELEIIVVEWIAKMIRLPVQFSHEATGGGCIQSSASDCVLLALLAARHKAIEEQKNVFEEAGDLNPETAVLSRLVGYHSSLAHSCVEKAGMIAFVKMRAIEVDEHFSIKIHVLEKAIKEDLRLGLIPFFICGTLGTTACCSFDNLKKLGHLSEKYGTWFHVDAAYAGNALICEEFQPYLEGIEHAMSFNFNPNKWLLVNFDCSLFWVADKDLLTMSMVVDPVYLQHRYSSKAVDFRNWGIPLSRRFRSLKLWFVLRIYGVEKLKAYIRNHVRLAQLFESLVRADNRFEIVNNVVMGLVCFRLRNSNMLTQCLLRTINESRELHMVPAVVNDIFLIRFCVNRESASEEDIKTAWNVIRHYADEIITAEASLKKWRVNVDTKRRQKRKSDDLLKESNQASTIVNGDENHKATPQLIASLHKNTEVVATSPTKQEQDFVKTLAEGETVVNGNVDHDNNSQEDDESSSNEGEDYAYYNDISLIDMTQIDDEALMDLANERLLELKLKDDRKNYEMLSQHLTNMGIENIPQFTNSSSFEESNNTNLVTQSSKDDLHTPNSRKFFNSSIDSVERSLSADPLSSSTPQSSKSGNNDEFITTNSDNSTSNNKSSCNNSHNNSSIVARLVSMVMNASGNRRRLTPNSKSASCYVKNVSRSKTISPIVRNNCKSVHFINEFSDNRESSNVAKAHVPGVYKRESPWRHRFNTKKSTRGFSTDSHLQGGVYSKYDDEDVFLPNVDDNYDMVKEGTLQKLKKLALLKMIYDVEPKSLRRGRPPIIRRMTDSSFEKSCSKINSCSPDN